MGNQERKVKEIYLELIEMLEANKPTVYCLKDQTGKVVAVWCYEHKQWEIVDPIAGNRMFDYGVKKSNTVTGLNTMCKQGYREWQRKYATFCRDKMNLADLQLTGDEYTRKLAEISEKRATVYAPPGGFEKLEDCAAYLKKKGVKLA